MYIRAATISDISELFSVRMSVKENVLVTLALVTDEICADYISNRGKGWVCEVEGSIVGFAIANLQGNSIWALFLRPEYEGRGIGRQLHNTMLDWYFSMTDTTVWLGTDANTRAEQFYRKAGWVETGRDARGEIRFEMSADDWRALAQK